MPQMSPMNWLFLLIFFYMLFSGLVIKINFLLKNFSKKELTVNCYDKDCMKFVI